MSLKADWFVNFIPSRRGQYLLVQQTPLLETINTAPGGIFKIRIPKDTFLPLLNQHTGFAFN